MMQFTQFVSEPIPATTDLVFPPRQVSFPILLTQVKNTVPFIFEPEFLLSLLECQKPSQSYLIQLLHLHQRVQAELMVHPHLPRQEIQLHHELKLKPYLDSTHDEYFDICLSAHHATVASFVPTDVDQQIRFKLWHPALDLNTLCKMATRVKESFHWDNQLISTRWVISPISQELLSGHTGEWLSTAVGAYAALRKRKPDFASEFCHLIICELQREAQIWLEFKEAHDGIGLLKAAALIAHNLGDLDRVIDQWNLPPDDPLRTSVYKAGHMSLPHLGDTLFRAGKLNKATMAIENHRHFALRVPKCLRKSPDFLLPVGPFFDEWGNKVAKHPALEPKEVGVIVEALVDGWEKLKGPVGYTRALAGILECFPGGVRELNDYLPARVSRMLKSGILRSLCSIPRTRFEEQWNRMGLKSS